MYKDCKVITRQSLGNGLIINDYISYEGNIIGKIQYYNGQIFAFSYFTLVYKPIPCNTMDEAKKCLFDIYMG